MVDFTEPEYIPIFFKGSEQQQQQKYSQSYVLALCFLLLPSS